MADTINDLYLKYTNKVGRTLESDRYFQYLYAMVDASDNTFLHQNQVLHKVVDEEWLTTIEASLDSINKIIEKPRRFITTREEVVPVDLAKKITADSVRHLSMNTQFIVNNDEGEIQPTRILNVSTEESYDLYENRFIYHLIQRLVTFIDKRTDIIFWSTGDEMKSTMSFESHVEDAYEEIEYKISMTVKNRQSLLENDTDNLSVFMRIDRVRRLVMALRNSSFCQLMAGCSKVHSPIQRTNLMMKDPDYRSCYKLWQFLENYDAVGYTIDVRETPLEFDEEYMIQMYTNLITNYTVFKSLLETDERKVGEIPTETRHVKPKFIKQIQEHFVNDRDIPDVEIRQVFIEEVTEAQLIAEAKVAELTEQVESLGKRVDEAEMTAQEYVMQLGQLMQSQIEMERTLNQEREARENAEAELAQLTQEAESALAEAEEQIQALTQETESLQAIRDVLEEEKQELIAGQQKLVEDAAAELAETKAELENAHLVEIEGIKRKHTLEITTLSQEHQAVLATQSREHEAAINSQQAEYEQKLADCKRSYEAQILAQKQQFEQELEAALASLREAKDAEAAAKVATATALVVEEQKQKLAALEARKQAELEAAIVSERKAKAEAEAVLKNQLAEEMQEKASIMKEKLSVETSLSQIEQKMIETDRQLAAVTTKKQELETAHSTLSTQVRSLEEQLAMQTSEYEQKLINQKEAAAKALAEEKEAATRALAEEKKASQKALAEEKEATAQAFAEQKEAATKALAEEKKSSEKVLAAQKAEAENKLQAEKQAKAEALEACKEEAKAKLSQELARMEELLKREKERADQEEKARIKAEKRADEQRLSNRISALFDRKSKKNGKE